MTDRLLEFVAEIDREAARIAGDAEGADAWRAELVLESLRADLAGVVSTIRRLENVLDGRSVPFQATISHSGQPSPRAMRDGRSERSGLR